MVEGGLNITSPSKSTVSSAQDLDLITKREEDDLKKTDSVEGRNIEADIINIFETQVSNSDMFIKWMKLQNTSPIKVNQVLIYLVIDVTLCSFANPPKFCNCASMYHTSLLYRMYRVHIQHETTA